MNQVYGSLNPNVTNVFSIHGNIDPWHRLGIVNDLSDNSPAILINGTSHCADLQGSSLSDSTEMKYAREQARKYITSWVQ